MGRKAFHGKISLILKRHLSFYFGWYSRIYQKVVGTSVKHKLFLKRMLCYLATRTVWKNRQKERIYPKHGTWKPPWVCHNVLSQLSNSKTPFYQYLTQIDPGSWEYTSQADTEALPTAASVERVATALERELHVYMRPCELFNLPFFSGLFLWLICICVYAPTSPPQEALSPSPSLCFWNTVFRAAPHPFFVCFYYLHVHLPHSLLECKFLRTDICF